MNFPLVTIITVSFNSESTIRQTILSVLNQTYPEIEYIIIDGASTDKTIDIISSLEDQFLSKKYNYKWKSEPDKGIYDAFNKGLLLATGEFVGFLNSDDWYENDCIQNFILEVKQIPAIYCGYMKLHTVNNLKEAKIFKSKPDRLFQTMRIAHPATLVSAAVFKQIGNFSTDYKIAGDYDFFLRAKLYGYNIFLVDRVLSNMRLGGASMNLPLVFKEELKVKNRNLGKKVRHYVWYLASLTVYLLKIKILISGTKKNLMRKLIDFILLKIKGQSFKLDSRIPLAYLFSLVISRMFMIIRGSLTFCKHGHFFFRDKGTVMKAKRKIVIGRGVSIGRNCFIDANSEEGIWLGDQVSIGKNTTIECTGSLLNLGKGLRVGNGAGLGTHGYFGCAGGIEIGKDTIFGNFVSLHSENHNFENRDIPIKHQGVNRIGIKIGNNCWIGSKATILDGAVIEDGCIIGAGSVVIKGIYSRDGIYAGVPAKLIKKRF